MPAFQFDLRTLLLMFTLIRVGQAVAMLHVWNTHRQYPPARDWAVGAFMCAMGMLLVGFRDLIPVWASVMLANIFLIPGWLIFDGGIVRAAGYRVPWRWGIAVVAVALSSIFWNSIVEPDYVRRLITFSLAVLIFDAFTVYTCLHNTKKNKMLTFRILAISLMVIMSSCIWRVVSGFNHNLSTILTPTVAQTQFFVITILFSVIISIMLVLLTAQRLQEEMNEMAQQLIRQHKMERDYAQINALTDSLTGLANRRHFDEVLNTEFYRLRRSGASLSMIMLDVDHFKKFNDTYGHLAGDECLRQVAAALKRVVGRVPDLAARYGGEEFAVILPETVQHGAGVLAERIRKEVEGLAIPHETSRVAAYLTVSLGVVTVSAINLSAPEEVVALADKALYCAKQSGRNRIEFAHDKKAQDNSDEKVHPGFVRLVWHEADECGHRLIDEQHRQLFLNANLLLTAIIERRPKDECLELVRSLLTDAARHFEDEETVFRAAGYPLADEHSRLHADLVAGAVLLTEKYESDDLSLGEIFSFIAYDVVAQHLFIEDKKFFAYIG